MAVLNQIRGAEIEQERLPGRAVSAARRKNPVRIKLLTNIPGPWPVDEVAALDDLLPKIS